MADEDDGINLLDMVDVLLDQKFLIALVTAIVLAIGGGYALTTTPIYEANSLIQVEDTKGNSLGALMGENSAMFDVKSPASAEIEILRSRLVVGQAASNLQLDLSVTPKYVPYIGSWLSRSATEPSKPSFAGFKGYVSGNESLRVGRFDIPAPLHGMRFSVLATDTGYELVTAEGSKLGQGLVGKPLGFSYQGHSGELLIAKLVGNPGAEFFVTRRSLLGVTQQLQNQMKITEQGRQSGVLRVTLEGPNPDRIAQILNEVGNLYVRQNTERKAAEAKKSLEFLNTQLPQLKKQLEDSEASFNLFRTQQGTFDLDTEASAFLSQVVSLKVKLFEQQSKRKELELRYTAKHPSIEAVDISIRDIKAELREAEKKVKKLPIIEQDLLRLTRDVKVDSALYTNLLNSAQQLGLVKEGKVGNVRIIDKAIAPEAPIKPNKSSIVGISALLGLLAGLGLAFLRNSLRPGIKNAEELEHRLGLNVFATIPLSAAQQQLDADTMAKKPGTHLLATLRPNEAAIESLRSLRTALQFAMLEAPNNIVLITGPTPNIGKSFTAANFAAVLAAAGQRVLLIDADMRKGHVNQFFGLARGMGFSELVTGTQALDKVLHRNVVPGLDFITTGTMPPNPAELLMSPTTQALFKSLSAQYDLVPIDSPPVLAVSDTAILAPQAGTTFMVVRADVSSLGEVQEAVKRIAQSGETVKGIIFNGLDISKRRYGYGYGYGYGYKYKRYGYRYQSYNYGQDNKGK
jgi:tyrosine-protein kinase Etk/Wzc